MPMIAPQRKPDKQAVNLKLDRRLSALLKAYADCITSTQEYVLNEALLATFTADTEFRGWLDATRPAEAEALRTLLEERPPTRVPGRHANRKAATVTRAPQPDLDLTSPDTRTPR